VVFLHCSMVPARAVIGLSMCDDDRAHAFAMSMNEDELGYGGGLRYIQEHHCGFCLIARTAHTNAKNTLVGMDYRENIAQELVDGTKYARSTHSDHHQFAKSWDAGNAHGSIWVASCRFSSWAIRQPCVTQRSLRRRYCTAVVISRNTSSR